MTELAIIEDSTILTMLRDPRFTEAIPCLANKLALFKQAAGGCGTCAQKRKEKQRTEMAKIKSCLAALAPDKKVALKQLLDAKKVRVTYVNAAGTVVQLTF
jgi:hypothetical protein